MLKNVDPLLSADLLHALAAMGHGDTIALVDANFPAAARARRLIVMPGTEIGAVLAAVLSVLPCDRYVSTPAQLMQVGGDAAEPETYADFRALLSANDWPMAEPIERFAFYTEAAQAFAIVLTGERRLYGNIILRKGVIP